MCGVVAAVVDGIHAPARPSAARAGVEGYDFRDVDVSPQSAQVKSQAPQLIKH
jgi:hypothetical protein